MHTPYRIFGSEASPYSVKVRSYFRYKQIPHEWIIRNAGNMDAFKKYAKLPLIPLVITPDDRGIQDSTPILEEIEAIFPQPSIRPGDPTLAFLSALIEEYGDEWGNKWMFHYRWTYEADGASAALRIARDNLPGADDEAVREVAESIKVRMVPRLAFVGSSAETREQIEESFREMLTLVEAHLLERQFLFGNRPALADFGLYPQLYQCSTDPTPAALMRDCAPRILDWIDRMLDPKAEGEFESWDALEPTLRPLLEVEVAGRFLPWSAANARAIAAGEKEFTAEIAGGPFHQDSQKYHAKSLAALKARYAESAERGALDAILDATGCGAWLRD